MTFVYHLYSAGLTSLAPEPQPTAPLKFSNTGEEGLLFQRALPFLLFAFLFHFKERGLLSHARAGVPARSAWAVPAS